MKRMIFITPSHLHSSGSTSYTRLINLAQVETEPARGSLSVGFSISSAEQSMVTAADSGSPARRRDRIPNQITCRLSCLRTRHHDTRGISRSRAMGVVPQALCSGWKRGVMSKPTILAQRWFNRSLLMLRMGLGRGRSPRLGLCGYSRASAEPRISLTIWPYKSGRLSAKRSISCLPGTQTMRFCRAFSESMRA